MDVILTALLALVLTLLFYGSGSLLVPMVAHALIDPRILLLPMLTAGNVPTHAT